MGTATGVVVAVLVVAFIGFVVYRLVKKDDDEGHSGGGSAGGGSGAPGNKK